MRTVLVAAALLGTALAQEAPKAPRVQKIVQLKHADALQMVKILDVFGCCARGAGKARATF